MTRLDIPPPPVPQKLREMLKDYPEHLQELQEVLDRIVAEPPKGTPPFEMAVWMLGDTLGDSMINARKELKAAETSGDSVLIEKAKAKEFAMGYARANMWMPDLRAYFDEHKAAFE